MGSTIVMRDKAQAEAAFTTLMAEMDTVMVGLAQLARSADVTSARLRGCRLAGTHRQTGYRLDQGG